MRFQQPLSCEAGEGGAKRRVRVRLLLHTHSHARPTTPSPQPLSRSAGEGLQPPDAIIPSNTQQQVPPCPTATPRPARYPPRAAPTSAASPAPPKPRPRCSRKTSPHQRPTARNKRQGG